MLNESSRAISQINYSDSFPELVLLEQKLRVPASKSSIALLRSDINWLFFKKIRVKKHNLNNYEFYMNLNVRISIVGNFPIKTSEVLLVFHNVL